MCRSHGDQNGSPIALKLMACTGSCSIKLRGHENRAAPGVDEQMSASVSIQEKAIVGRPVQHFLPAPSYHRDIESFNLHLLQHRCLVVGPSRRLWSKAQEHRVCLAEEALQCPCATRFDFDWHCRERHNPSQVRNRMRVGLLVCEGSQVTFNAVM